MSTFSGCSSLEKVTIPAKVEYIYQAAFANCTSLREINALPTTPPFIYNNTFSNYSVQVNVPTGCADAYKAHDIWKNFTNISDGNVYYPMTITVGTNGSVTYSGQTVSGASKVFDVKEGTDVVLTITADAGYEVAMLTVNGEDATSLLNNGTLSISNVTANTTVAVTFEQISGYAEAITISEAGKGTYCSNHDLDFSEVSGLKAYIASGYDWTTGSVLLTRVSYVPAGTGLMLVGAQGKYDVPASATSYVYANMLRGVLTATTVATESDGCTNYILANGAQGVLFYKSSGSGQLPANRAYLSVPASVQSAPAHLNINFDDESTTGISNVSFENSSRQEPVFNLQGQRLSTPRRGLNIVGGRKVLVK